MGRREMYKNKPHTIKVLQNKMIYVTVLIFANELQKVLQTLSEDCFLTLGLGWIEIS
jgi:hypothetical protein